MADDPKAEFQTYLFFLRHFGDWTRAGRAPTYGLPLIQRLITDQAPLVGTGGGTILNDGELSTVRKYLFTSWNAEALARISTVFDAGVRRFTNQWKPIQCYYAIYFQLVAVHYVATKKTQKAHEPTIRYASNSIVHKLPRPWSCRVNYDTGVFHGFLPGTTGIGPSGWNLSNNDPEFHTACFLRRTAARKQEELFRLFRQQKRKIPEGKPRAGKRYRSRSEVEVGVVSVFDVLWRFRTWANYHEGDTVIDGGEYTDHAVEFDARFNELTDTTSLLCEHILARALGPQVLKPLYAEFLMLSHGHLDTDAVSRRRAVLCP